MKSEHPNQGAPAQTCPKLGYKPALDGLRGLAILLVLGYHAPLGQSASLLPGGAIGVDIFFVLSGFLITTLLLQEFDQTGSISLRLFYMRRILRLAPALIVLLIVLCSLSFVLFDHAQARQNCLTSLIALFYVSNWVKVYTHIQLGLVAHTWSLSMEEQFYLIWPLLLLLLLHASSKKRYIVAVATAIALLSWAAAIHLTLTGATPDRISFGLDTRVDTLMIGCILAVLLASTLMTERFTRFAQRISGVIAPVSLLILVSFSVSGDMLGQGMFYFGFVLIAVLAAVMILDAMINPNGILSGLLTLKWLVWIGSISYGLYLWHWPIYYAMYYKFGFPGWTVVLVGTPLTFMCVLLSYYLLEKPVLELKKHFTASKP